jgi:hypothetical protein
MEDRILAIVHTALSHRTLLKGSSDVALARRAAARALHRGARPYRGSGGGDHHTVFASPGKHAAPAPAATSGVDCDGQPPDNDSTGDDNDDHAADHDEHPDSGTHDVCPIHADANDERPTPLLYLETW